MLKKATLFTILLLLCSMNILAKKKNRRNRQFVQQMPEIGVTISDFLAAPASSESSGCFYDTPSQLISILDTKVDKYSTKCDLDAKNEVKGVKDLLELAKTLGEIKGNLVVDPDYLKNQRRGPNFGMFYSKTAKYLNSLSEITIESINKAMFVFLDEEWKDFAKENKHTTPMRKDAWTLAEFGFAKNFLSSAYGNNMDDCLPVNDDIKRIIDLIVIDLNQDYPELVQSEVFERVLIDPIGFEYGGYGLAFWLKEDSSDLGSPFKIVQGFINNQEKFSLKLECCTINHILTVGNEQYSVRSAPPCTEYVFALLAFEKDCDSYKVTVVLRLTNTNLRYVMTSSEKITADELENLQLAINKNAIINPLMFTHFKYSEEAELRILSKMTSSYYQPIIDLIGKCSGMPPDCRYNAIDRGCIACKAGTYLYYGECYKTCPNGTYVHLNETCEDCIEGCNQCQDDETCDICNPDYVFYQDICLEKCPDNTTETEGRICKECTPHCHLCYTMNECLKCEYPYHLYDKKCVEYCPIGTYLDQTINECKPCSSNCIDCDSATICKECNNKAVLFQHKCLSVCPTYYTKDPTGKMCIPCPPHCPYCNSNQECTQCEKDWLVLPNKTCGGDCPVHYTPIKKICFPCGDFENCDYCSWSNVNHCKSCSYPYVLLPNLTCADNCDDFYYADDNRICQRCSDPNAQKCTKDKILLCKPGTYLFEDKECVNECPDCYIPDGTVCRKCESCSCKKCSKNDLGICTLCHYPSTLLKEGECIAPPCGNYYFQDGQNCKRCVEGCLECDNQFYCDRCDLESGYYLKDNTCTLDCGKGYRANNQTGKCEKCSVSNCQYCNADKDYCDLCHHGFFLYNNYCYEPECPPRTYLLPNGYQCSNCLKNCDKCVDGISCDDCISPYVLQNNKCQLECDDGYYSDKNRICRPCSNPRCKRCNTDPQICDSCLNDLLKYKIDCYETVLPHTYEQNGTLFDCADFCESCIDSAEHCLSCRYNLTYDPDTETNTYCTDKCPPGEVAVNGTCVDCGDQNCHTCDNRDINCCLYPMSGFLVRNCDVFDHCNVTQFALNSTCVDCITGCDICNSTNSCIDCSEGYFLNDDGVCVKECKDGYIGFNKKCIKCGSDCIKCQPHNTLYCTVCPFGKILCNGQCLSQLGAGYYEKNGVCEKCQDQNCALCDDEEKDGKTCQQCKYPPYVLYENKCLEKCPKGTVDIDGICVSCGIAHSSYCTKEFKLILCEEGYFYYSEKECRQQCPPGTVVDTYNYLDYQGHYCKSCPNNAEECSVDGKVKSCFNPYVLQGNVCQKQCNPGFYPNEYRICIECPFPNCKKCTARDCLECFNDLYLKEDDETCHETCPDFMYGEDRDIKLCRNCPLNCRKCDNPLTCLECDQEKEHLVLRTDGQCEGNCTDGTVEINHKCVMCNSIPNCLNCAKDLTTCINCKGSFVLYNKTETKQECLAECPNGYYNDGGFCRPCYQNCEKCQNSKYCELCSENYYKLPNQEACGICPIGYYNGTRVCEQCSSNCDHCIDSTFCSNCTFPYLREEGVCVKEPSTGYFKYNDYESRKCSDNCLHCNNEYDCIECIPGLYVLEGFCDHCKPGQLPVGFFCKDCVPNCLECGNTINECRVCQDGYFLHEKKCHKECPVGYYEDKETKECKSCISHCDQCDDSLTCNYCSESFSLYEQICTYCPLGYSSFNRVCLQCEVENCIHCSQKTTICDECRIGTYLFNNTCYQTCPDGTYPNGKICSPCLDECSLCSNGKSCLSCKPGLSLFEKRCHDTCPDGMAPVDGICKNCTVKDCKLCNSNDLSECFECKTTYLKKWYDGKYECVEPDCGPEFYLEGKKCYNCLPNCHECKDPDSCLVCNGTKVLYDNRCEKDTCPQGYAEKDRKCYSCGQNCADCNPNDLGQCYRCFLNYTLLEDKCVPDCPLHYFKVSYSDRFECHHCPYKCSVCESESFCNICTPPYVRLDGNCVEKCPIGYYSNNGDCFPCNDFCDYCSLDILSNTTKCSQCKSPYFIAPDYSCVDVCPEHYVGIDGKCVPCQDGNCLKCNPSNNCTICDKDMAIFDKRCVTVCPNGYYRDIDNFCKPCEDKTFCKTCSTMNPSKCLDCLTYRYNGTCYPKCPEGTYNPFGTHECRPCSSNCLQCEDENKCLVCKNDFYLDSYNMCVQCDEGHQIKVNGLCMNCTDNLHCDVCLPSDLSFCDQCDGETVKYKGKCLDRCPKGTFLQGGVCYECESNCADCTDATTCIECKGDNVLYKYDCYRDCFDHYVNVSKVCQPCTNDNCLKCSPKNLSFCERCMPGLIKYKGECLISCPVGMFYNPEIKTCDNCTEGCLQCQNKLTCDICKKTEVIDGRIVKGRVYYPPTGKCIIDCPPTYYQLPNINECSLCMTPFPCSICDPSNPTQCYKCPEGYYRKQLGKYVECVKEIPSGYYPVNDEVIICPYPCSQCTSAKNCTSCFDTFKLNNFKCDDCENGYTYRNGMCLKCQDLHCLKCDTNNLNACTDCEYPFILHDEDCLRECPPHHFLRNNTIGKLECVDCKQGCDTCDENGCTSCLNEYYPSEKNELECVTCSLPKLVINGICKECKVPGCSQCQYDDDHFCNTCSGKLLRFNGTCLEKCPDGFFAEGRECVPCDPGCELCNGHDKCLYCNSTLALLNGRCIDHCPEYYRKNTELRICEPCDGGHCLYCPSSKQICEACQRRPDSFFLYHDVCLTECPIRTMVFNYTCVDCSSNCLHCENSLCTECEQGYYRKDGKCVKECGVGYYAKDQICYPCSTKNCISCPNNVCTQCIPQFYVNRLNNIEEQCSPTCSQGYYPNEKSHFCEKCKYGCKTCSNNSTCLTCLDNFFRYKDICVRPCPDKMTPNDGACVPCTQKSCNSCSINEPSHCVNCQPPMLRYLGTCQENCPLGTYNNSYVCEDCDPKCDECSSKDYCLDCKDGYVRENGICKDICSPGYVKIGEECIACQNERCKACSIDLHTCFECYNEKFLYNGDCYEECPIGTYPDEDTKKCIPCDHSCEKCDKNHCLQCRRGYYYFNNETCVENCPTGFYEDCSATSRKCVPCDPSCLTCALNTNYDCIDCKEGYFMYNHACIKETDCPKGTYFDNSEKAPTCKKCDLLYCAECSSKGTCDRCHRGFDVINGKCVAPKIITPIIKDYILVDSYTSYDEEIRASERFDIVDYQSTGVGRKTVTLSFYFRSLMPYLETNLVLLAVINPKGEGYNMKFIIDHNDNRCKFIITDENDAHRTVVDADDCSYDKVYNWRFVSLTLVKKKVDYKATVNMITNGKVSKYSQNLETHSHSTVLENDAYIMINYNDSERINPSNGVFQIGKLNVLDYYPAENQLLQLSTLLPSNCDYFCTSCSNICLSCPSGLLPSGDKCLGHFIREDPELFINPTVVSMHLRDYLSGKLSTDGYGFTQWIYVNNTEGNYLIYQIDFAKSSNHTPYIKMEIDNGRFLFNGEDLGYDQMKTESWYFISVKNTPKAIDILIETDSLNFTANITHIPFIRQHEDFVYTLHSHTEENQILVTSVYNSKIYINNVPSESDYQADRYGFKCQKYCSKCDKELKCEICEDGYEIEDGVCIEKKLDEYVELENIYDLWNKDTKSYDVTFKDNLTIALNIRKKTHSNIYQTFNKYSILSYSNGKKVTSLITEGLIEEFVSEYSLIGNEQWKQWKHNYTEEVTDFITVVILVNRYTKTISFKAIDYSINEEIEFSASFDDSITKLIIGDINGYEMNTEISNLRIFNGYASQSLQSSLQSYPNFCGGICNKCDFETGLCLTCAFDSQEYPPRKCQIASYKWSPAYQFGYNDWSFVKTMNSYLYVYDYNKVNLNAESYSMSGLVQMFKTIEGARYRLACVHNDYTKKFRPENNRGKELICLDSIVTNGEISFIIKVNDGGSVSVPVKDFTFVNKEWISVVINVNIVDMLMQYDIMKNENNDIKVHGEYSFKHVPEKVQESSSISVFGRQDEIDKSVYTVPHVNFYTIGLIPNQKYSSDLIYQFTTINSSPKCFEGCDVCVWDVTKTKGLCFECETGYDQKYTSRVDTTVSCTKSTYKVAMFKGEIVNSNTEYKVTDKSIYSGEFSIYFQTRFNYPFWKFNGQTIVLALPPGLSIFVNKGKMYALINNKEATEILLDDPYNKWNHVFITRLSSQLQITVRAGSYLKQVAIKSNYLSSIKPSTIKVTPTRGFISFYSIGVTSSTTISAIEQAEPANYADCGIDCAYCEKGICKVCGNGYEKNGSCSHSKNYIMPGYYSPNNGELATLFLVEEEGIDRVARIKKWTVQFNVEFDSIINGKKDFFTFLNYNGIDSISSYLDMQKGQLTLNLMTIEEVGELQAIELQLPNAPVSPFLYISIAYDNDSQQLKVLFAETSSNYVKNTYKLGGHLGYFGAETSLVFYGTVNTKITNVAFDYSNAETIAEMTAEMNKYARKVQKDCLVGTATQCTKCQTGRLENGICVKPESKFNLMTMFSEYIQINKENPSKVFKKQNMNTLTEFTIMFNARLTSLSTMLNNTPLPVVSLKINNQDVMSITYSNSPSAQFSYKLYKINNGGAISDAFTQSPYEWHTIMIIYSPPKGQLLLYAYNLSSSSLKIPSALAFNVPTGPVENAGTYELVFGKEGLEGASFEFSGVEFIDKALTAEEIDKYRFLGTPEIRYGCTEMIVNTCQKPLPTPIALTKTVYKYFRNVPLFTKVYETSNNHAFNKYLISLEINMSIINRGEYTANPTTLFLFTDEFTSTNLKLEKSNPLPVSTLRTGLSMSLVGNSLVVRPPLQPWAKGTQQTYVIQFKDSTFKSNILIQLVGDALSNKLSLEVIYDGTSYFYDVTIGNEQRAPTIGTSTLVYGHPALSYFAVNFNSPRLDYEAFRYAKNINNSCVVGNGNTFCPNCMNQFKTFRPGCNTGEYDLNGLNNQ